MSDLIGQRLGQYEIVALLGRGGMATVYRAHQTSIGRDVALKVIKPELSATKDFMARFEREARTIASLSHPYILKVFDYGQQGDIVYLVMEMLKGGSLADLVQGGPLSVERTSRILDQIASALDYAHGMGIIHRDLKPQNVLLDDQGNAHLTDFGIAKILSATVLTQTGMAMGTPAYMSPEQWQGQTIDARSDLYALGIMVYEMLTGRLPFNAETPFGLMHMHIYEPPPPIQRADLPLGVNAVLAKAMAKDRAMRYASAAEFGAAFRAALSGATSPNVAQVTAPQRVTGNETTFVAQKSATNRSGLIAIGAAVVVLLLGVGLVAVLNSSRGGMNTSTAETLTSVAALATTVQPTSIPPTTEQPTSNPVIVSISSPTSTVTMTVVPPTALPATETPNLVPTFVAATLLAQADLTAQAGTISAFAAGTQTAQVPTATKTSSPTNTIAASPTFTNTATVAATNTATLTATTAPTVADTSTPTMASTATAATIAAPVGKIAFGSKRNGKYQLYKANAEDGTATRLFQSSADDFGPTWSNDGQRLAFTSNRSGHNELYSISAEGADLQQLTHNGADNYAPAWSPDGSKIAWHSNRDGNWEIYVANADGSNPHRMTNNPGDDTDPAWSPDGTHLAFHSKRIGSHGIYVMNVTSAGNPIRLTPDGIDALDPAWSPDGQYIAFTVFTNKKPSLYIMNADGTNSHPLISGVLDENDQPAWDPNSHYIVFRSKQNGKFNLYIVDINGQNPQQLTNEGDDNEFPTWQPGVG